jgi:hypothetical protein
MKLIGLAALVLLVYMRLRLIVLMFALTLQILRGSKVACFSLTGWTRKTHSRLAARTGS